ncbi:MAG: DUF1844 domain-containing protein [Candidatus Methylomirabilales bacterium]
MSNKAAGEEEEPSFRVTDRRRVGSEGAAEPGRAPESQAERAPDPPHPPQAETPPPEAEGNEQALHLAPLPELVRIFIAEFEMRALIHMGLIPNPATRLVTKDLPQARLAIDCTAALIEQLSPSAAPAERDELQQVLTNLRLHFVQQSGT